MFWRPIKPNQDRMDAFWFFTGHYKAERAKKSDSISLIKRLIFVVPIIARPPNESSV
jgi:hypothetical protein